MFDDFAIVGLSTFKAQKPSNAPARLRSSAGAAVSNVTPFRQKRASKDTLECAYRIMFFSYTCNQFE